MGIRIHCEHCHKALDAPESAAGKRGACPHCGGSNYIPLPKAPGEEDEIPLVEVDEEEERQRQREVKHLLEVERDVLAETSRAEDGPRLEQKDQHELAPADVHHLVINFCLDMANGQLERADTHLMKLNEFPRINKQAVREVMDGQVDEPALEKLPPKVLEGFLKNLMNRLR